MTRTTEGRNALHEHEELFRPWGTVTPAFWGAPALAPAAQTGPQAQIPEVLRERLAAVAAAATGGELQDAAWMAYQLDIEIAAECGVEHLNTVHIREVRGHIAHLMDDHATALDGTCTPRACGPRSKALVTPTPRKPPDASTASGARSRPMTRAGSATNSSPPSPTSTAQRRPSPSGPSRGCSPSTNPSPIPRYREVLGPGQRPGTR